MMYKNYRAKFLIFWASVNAIVGIFFQAIYNNGDEIILFSIAVFLISIMAFRVVISFIHRLKAKYDRFWVNWQIKKRHSTVFDHVGEAPEVDDSDVFSVYYDEEDKDMIIKPSNKNIAFSNKTLLYSEVRNNLDLRRSSVSGAQILRGFSIREIKQKHLLAQGRSEVDESENGKNFGIIDSALASQLPEPIGLFTNDKKQYVTDDEEDKPLDEYEESSDSSDSFEDHKSSSSGANSPSNQSQNSGRIPTLESLVRNTAQVSNIKPGAKSKSNLNKVVPIKLPPINKNLSRYVYSNIL